MTNQFDATYYEDIRGRVRGILIEVAGSFSASQMSLVDELIDANEPAVALEILVGMLVEAHISVTPGTVDHLESLARIMNLSSVTAEIEKLRE